MRKKFWRQLLVAQGSTYEPTPLDREKVRHYIFNDLPHDRIARLLGITMAELQFHFRIELEMGEDELLAWYSIQIARAAAKVDTATGPAVTAALAALRPRVRRWRVPKEEPAQVSVTRKAVSQMTLAEMEDELAEIYEEEAQEAAAAGHDPGSGGEEKP